MTPPAARDLLTAVSRHRALVAGGLAAGSAALALSVVAPAPPATVGVLVTTHDLAAGAVVGADDVASRAVPAGLVPAGALTGAAAAVGRPLAGAVRAGETLTDVRLLGAGLGDALPPGLVAAPVRLADPAMAALLHPGDRVDVLSADTGRDASVAAADVQVLSVPALPGDAGQGALVVLAASPADAARLAAAAVAGRLSVTVRGR